MSARLAEEIWYGRHPLADLLAPLGWTWRGAAAARRGLYASGLRRVHRLGVPVVVVGNICVGGSGKTPLVIALVPVLRELGLEPGIVCRGYGGRAASWPQQVRADSDPRVVGDEPVVIARRARCPVAVAPDRVAAARSLLDHAGCDVVVSDDGLQHLALGRDVEIAVIDGERRHGNARCLPAGPLREPPARLRTVDLVVATGRAEWGEHRMALVPGADAVAVGNPDTRRPLADFRGGPVHAVCGIGNPARFFESLRALDLEIVPHAFRDHHDFAPQDVRFADGRPVLMTEKDAIKCERFARPGTWQVPVTARLDGAFRTSLRACLERTGALGSEAACDG